MTGIVAHRLAILVSLFFLVLAAAHLGTVTHQSMAFSSGINREMIQAFTKKLLPNTSWVSDRFPIYFCTERELCKINTDGSAFQTVFRSEEPVGVFHFSPDGKMLLMLTGPSRNLYLEDLDENKISLIDSLKLAPDERGGIAISARWWSPDDNAFLYRKASWNARGPAHGYRTREFCFYDVRKTTKQVFDFFPLSDVAWQSDGNSFLYNEWERPPTDRSVYLNRISEVPLATSKPQKTGEYKATDNALENMPEKLGAKLFVPKHHHDSENTNLRSEKGEVLRYDASTGYLCYIDANGRVSKLFQVPSVPVKHTAMLPKISRLPGERYVVMVVEFTEKPITIIMDPASGKMERLTAGKRYAWHQQKARE